MAYALHLMALQTPVGLIVVEGNAEALTAVRILADGDTALATPAPDHCPTGTAVRQLAEYFGGSRQNFDLPLTPLASERGMVLRSGMLAIPYGETTTYGAIALALDSAPRAVGQACRRNPFPIIVPCHRVTSTSGPEFYSGGEGAATKAWLIAFERRNLPTAQRTPLS